MIRYGLPAPLHPPHPIHFLVGSGGSVPVEMKKCIGEEGLSVLAKLFVARDIYCGGHYNSPGPPHAPETPAQQRPDAGT